MDGDGPCQTERKLGEGAYLLFLYLMLFLVERIAHVAPGFRADRHGHTVFGHHIQRIVLLVYLGDTAQCAVDPALLRVILHEDNLRTFLQLQVKQGGQGRFGKLATYLSVEDH